MTRPLAALALVLGVVLAVATFVWFVGSDAARGGGESTRAAARAAQPDARPAPATLLAQGPAQPQAAQPGEGQVLRQERRDLGAASISEASSEAGSQDLGVIVLDAQRRPLEGVKVELVRVLGDDDADGPSLLQSAVSDAEGRARLAGGRVLMAGEQLGRFLLLHDVLLDEDSKRWVERDEPADWIELRLPLVGAVDVVVRELDGSVVSDGTRVSLGLIRPDESTDPTLADQRAQVHGATLGGVARFPHVVLGREVEAFAQREVAEAGSRARGAGPRLAFQTATIEVVLGADYPVVFLRAIDSSGAPLANTPIDVSLHELFSWKHFGELTTDASGVFAVDIRDAAFGPRLRVLAEVGDRTLLGSWTPESNLSPGRHDGGDVRLEPIGPLASGRVVWTDGTGADHARVEASVSDQWWFSGDGAMQAKASTLSGADGRFVLEGALLEDEFELAAEKDGHRSRPVAARRGESGWELVLEESLQLSGSIEADPGISVGDFELRLYVFGEEASLEVDMEYETASQWSAPNGLTRSQDGHFAIDDLAPGRYRLEVLLQEEVVAVVEPIELVGDLVLDPIDLRGRVFLHQLELLTAEGDAGSAALQGSFAFRASDADEDADWNTEGFEGVGVAMASTDPFVDVRLRVDGFRAETIEELSGRRVVRLRPALRIRLVLLTEGTLPRYPYLFDVDVRDEHDSVARPAGSAHFTQENREVVLDVSHAGTLNVRWHLERRGGNYAIGSHVLSEHSRTIEVLDVAGEQVFELELDGAALTRLAERPPF